MIWESNIPFEPTDVAAYVKPASTTAVIKHPATITVVNWTAPNGYNSEANLEGNGTYSNSGGGGLMPPITIVENDIYLREEDNDVLYTELGLPLEVEN